MVVVSPLVTLFSLCSCLLMNSLCLLPPLALSLSPAGCCVTSCCTNSASCPCCLLLRCHLSLTRRLVVVLPLVAPSPPCISPHHSTAFRDMPADCHITSHHATLFYANLHMGNPCMQTGIQICMWQFPFADEEQVDVVSLHMHTGILPMLICIWGMG
jgi:hypothetical protein